MGLKDLLVYVDNGHHCPARLDAAISLAQSHDAHLIGLYAIMPPIIPEYIRAQIGDEILKHQADLALAAAGEAEALFDASTKKAGINAEWRLVKGPPLAVASLHARYADVAIVGQRDPSGEDAPDDPTMPDQLILTIGRPVLVVPHAGHFPVIGERIMVAWDASRLATRAINDALPFLTTAKHVIVMAINPERGTEGHGDIPSADICLHLARHGVHAEAQHVFADDMGVGEMLLSRAADEGIDLIVMGAYGHARWREVVLGGATRHMLSHMTRPVLMSH
jgi:nucleotide-binding universal stress UspA family protein